MDNPPPPPPPGDLPPPPPPPGGYAPPPPPPPPPGGYMPPPPPGAGYPAPGAYQPAPVPAYGYAPQARYGGFWIRFVAVVIDGIIVSIPILIIAVILGVIIGIAVGVSGNSSSQTTTAASNTAGGLGELVGFVISVGYFVYFWGRGSTLGMRLFHLRVADATTGAPIGYGRAALRYVGYILSVIVCYIGLIWAAFDSRKQGWHDKIAGTVVLQE